MSNLLQLQSGYKAYGARELFVDAQFAINEGEHVGVIGPNGAGKTTLFKILTEQESLDSGVLVRSQSLRVGYLPQHDEWLADQSVESFLTEGCRTPIWELKSLGLGLGLSNEIFAKPVTALSGGYRMRVKLLYLIGQEPNLMLLDEPTNYLDLETTLVLERFLQGFKGAFLLISHDREFLRRTTDHILEVELGEITKFNGNLDDYFEQKSMLRSQLEARASSLQDKRERVLDFVSKFGAKATKAKQAQSRLKSLDRMETIELKSLPVTATIKIPPPTRAGKLVAKLEGAEIGYGEKTILKDVDFLLQNGDHFGVVGLNGAGKSTLLKAIAGSLPLLKGQMQTGELVNIGYYTQHVAEGLDPNFTVIENMVFKAHRDVTRQETLDMAGSLLFSGNDIQKKTSLLSGGEKSRVALGQILLQKASCLILDEPTNHLDFQTVEALTQALMNYPGTLIVVSHDRSFVRRVGSKILEIDHGRVRTYLGTYDDYVWSLEKGILSEASATANSFDGKKKKDDRREKTDPTKSDPRPSQNHKELQKELGRALRACEKRIAEIDGLLQTKTARRDELNALLMTDSGEQLLKLSREYGDLQLDINALEAEWLELSEKREKILLENRKND